MKLVVTGATGYAAREVLLQAMRRPEITSIVAVARSPVQMDGPGADKITSVTLPDYNGAYPESVTKAIAGADACIWTVAVTPIKAGKMDAAAVKRVCHDSTFSCLDALLAAGPAARPLRFMYMSGYSAQRDPTKPPFMFADYSVMRGETENQLLSYAAARPGDLAVSIAKPGIIKAPGLLVAASSMVAGCLLGTPSVGRAAMAKALLDQVVAGFEKDTLENADLVRLGKGASSK